MALVGEAFLGIAAECMVESALLAPGFLADRGTMHAATSMESVIVCRLCTI